MARVKPYKGKKKKKPSERIKTWEYVMLGGAILIAFIYVILTGKLMGKQEAAPEGTPSPAVERTATPSAPS